MDRKTKTLINQFLANRTFLDDKEFQEKIKPKDLMTYKEIKETIYASEFIPNEFFTDIVFSELTMFPNPKKTDHGMIMHTFENPSFLQLKSTASYCKFGLINAIQNSHIQAGDASACLFLKVHSLQAAFI